MRKITNIFVALLLVFGAANAFSLDPPYSDNDGDLIADFN